MSTYRTIIFCIFVLLLAPLSLLGVRAQRAATWFDDSAMAVWVFDVGQGDAIFIDAPEAQVLIDGGPDARVLEKLGEVLPPWDRTLDVVIASHPHADHVFGLSAVLERFDVAQIVASGAFYDEAAQIGFAAMGGSSAIAAEKGMTWDLGNGARLDIIWPEVSAEGAVLENVHEANVVALLSYGETSMLLTGDAEAEEERQFLLDLPVGIDILKVGHHGSDTSTSHELVNVVDPSVAIVSVGSGNDYGHPSPIVLNRLLQAGATLLRTDIDGDIRIWSNGSDPKIVAF